jgi:ribosome-binding protein aMBF1 (putative translation factor)
MSRLLKRLQMTDGERQGLIDTYAVLLRENSYTLGELREARKDANLVQFEVAERMKTAQSVIARIEQGTHSPTIDTLQRYAEAVGGRLEVRIIKKRKGFLED